MKATTRHQWWILIIAAVVFFTNLGGTRLWDDDEAYFAGTAVEMMRRGEYVVPQFNGEMFAHKPPWMYWMMIAAFHVLGVTEFAARFLPAVFGVATCLLTYHVGRRLFNPRVGLIAGIALSTCVMFSVVARAATPDVYLTFFSTLALYIFAVTGFARHQGENKESRGIGELVAEKAIAKNRVLAYLPRSWAAFAAMYFAMGLAVLVKGPIGVVLPSAVIGLFLLCLTPSRPLDPSAPRWRRWREAVRRFGPANFFLTVWRMRPVTAAILVLVVAGPWYAAVAVKTSGGFLSEFFLVQHLQRAMTPMEGHQGPFFYYLLAVLIGMLPWSAFATPNGLIIARGLRRPSEHRVSLMFVICWAGVYLGLFSLAATKLPNYILPAYPALAIMVAYFFDRWAAAPEECRVLWQRGAMGTLIAIGVGLMLVPPIIGYLPIDGQTILARTRLADDLHHDLLVLCLVGLPIIIGATAALLLAERRRVSLATAALATTAVATLLVLWCHAVPRVDRRQTSQDLANAIRRSADGEDFRIAQHLYFRPSLVYYARQQVEPCATPADVEAFLDSPQARFVIVPDDRFEDLRDKLPPGVEIVARRPRFPKRGELLVIGNRGRRHSAAVGAVAEKNVSSQRR